jgi:hypothetical protein
MILAVTGEALRRREFVTLLGGAAAAWPLTARAQQAPLPVVGFVDVVDFLNPEDQAEGIAGAIKELVRRKVDVIVPHFGHRWSSTLTPNR